MSSWTRQRSCAKPFYLAFLTFRGDHRILAFMGFLWLLWERALKKKRDTLAKVCEELGNNKVIAELSESDPEMREGLRSLGVKTPPEDSTKR